MLSGRRTLLLTILVAVASCQSVQSRDLTQAERDAVADTVRRLTMLIQDAVSDLDIERQLAFFSDDPDFTFGEFGTWHTTKESIRETANEAYGSFRTLDFRWDSLRVSVLGPDAAVVSGIGRINAVDTTDVHTTGTIAATYVFEHRENDWQLVHGQTSHALTTR